MPDGLFGLSTNPANFGIDQPPDQGAQELEQALSQINRQNAPAFLEPLRVMGAEMGARTEMAKMEQVPSFKNIKFNSDGTIDASGVSIDTIQDLLGARDFQRKTLGGFAQEAAQLETELKRAQSQPWQQLATALAANMANQKDMPGWVRGMGQTAAQMNPTVDQLRAQYLGVMGKGTDIAERMVSQGIAEQRTQTDLAVKLMEMSDKDRKEVQQISGKIGDQLRLITRTGGTLTPDVVEEIVKQHDPNGLLPKEAVDRAVKIATGLSGTANQALDARLARQQTLAKTASDLGLQRGIDLAKATAPIRADLMREAFAITHGQSALEWERAKKTVDNEMNVALAQTKATGALNPASIGMLRAGLGTNIYIGSLGNMLKIPEIASAAEPAFLVDRDKKTGAVTDVRWNPEAVLPQAWKSIQRTEAENMIAHEMPRILALLFKQGVGAQMFRSQKGVELLNSLGVSNKIRVDQMQTILENIRHTNNLSNFAPVVMTTKLPWQQDADLAAMAGMNDPANAAFWEGKDAFGGKMPIHIPGGTTPGAAPSAAPSKSTFKFTTGKDYGPVPAGVKDGTTGNGGKVIAKGGRWIGA